MTNNSAGIEVKNKLEGEKLFKISRFKEVIKRAKPHKYECVCDGAN